MMSFLFLPIMWFISGVSCSVLVDQNKFDRHIMEFKSRMASFGVALPDKGLKGYAIQASPLDGCKEMKGPPLMPNDNNNFSWIVLVARYGGCTFENKVRNSEIANFSAAIIYNIDSDSVIHMGGSDATLIPSVFIGFYDATTIMDRFLYPTNTRVHLVLLPDDSFNINDYLLPFAVVIAICFLIMLSIVLYKCFQDYRRSRRHRLPKSALKKLPIIKFDASVCGTSDASETCCICLEDFFDGDKLRQLPCDHIYHMKCVDPWLLKNKRVCPQCRKRVFPKEPDETHQDSSSDEEEASGGSRVEDRAPLLLNIAPHGIGAVQQSIPRNDPGDQFNSFVSTSSSEDEENVFPDHSSHFRRMRVGATGSTNIISDNAVVRTQVMIHPDRRLSPNLSKTNMDVETTSSGAISGEKRDTDFVDRVDYLEPQISAPDVAFLEKSNREKDIVKDKDNVFL